MAIPDYQTLMLPLLKLLSDKNEYQMSDVVALLSDQFKLTEEEKQKLLPSGNQTIITNRVAWARTYLKKAGLIESPRRAYVRITDLGLTALQKIPSKIDVVFLEQFPQFVEFYNYKREKAQTSAETQNQTPEESFEYEFQKLNDELAQDLLKQIKGCTPDFFERLVIDLIVKMGYGGSRKDAGEKIGKSGDGGIDGIIKEDKLGLDTIYVQAKRWESTVSRPEIQKFAGALDGKGAMKGIFITTSTFSSEAQEYASRLGNKRIILIDGAQLAKHMIEHDVGVSPMQIYQLKKIDLDYFVEE